MGIEPVTTRWLVEVLATKLLGRLESGLYQRDEATHGGCSLQPPVKATCNFGLLGCPGLEIASQAPCKRRPTQGPSPTIRSLSALQPTGLYLRLLAQYYVVAT